MICVHGHLTIISQLRVQVITIEHTVAANTTESDQETMSIESCEVRKQDHVEFGHRQSRLLKLRSRLWQTHMLAASYSVEQACNMNRRGTSKSEKVVEFCDKNAKDSKQSPLTSGVRI
jgi:hypothetical protein